MVTRIQFGVGHQTPPVFIRFGSSQIGDDQPTLAEKSLMRRAIALSKQSKDPSTKVGAVITDRSGQVLREDFNRFPQGINEAPAERWERPIKYDFIEHAERNAIYGALRKGIALEGGRIFASWFPCINCAKAIISSGIRELVSLNPDYEHPRWGKEFQFAKKLLDEAGIKLRLFPEAAFLSE